MNTKTIYLILVVIAMLMILFPPVNFLSYPDATVYPIFLIDGGIMATELSGSSPNMKRGKIRFILLAVQLIYVGAIAFSIYRITLNNNKI